MNVFTHLGLSVIIKRVVERELEIKLNKAGFMYGNIKPDITSLSYKIPHFKDTASEFIKREISELMQYNITKYTKCERDFSERLGIVTHYLSDFFCHAHSKMFTGNIISHLLYEQKLAVFCRKNPSETNSFIYTRYMRTDLSRNKAFNYIDNLHGRYMSKTPSYSLDITFALRACITVVIQILSTCMENAAEIAA